MIPEIMNNGMNAAIVVSVALVTGAAMRCAPAIAAWSEGRPDDVQRADRLLDDIRGRVGDDPQAWLPELLKVA